MALEALQAGPPGLLHSPFLDPFPGPYDTLGFDRVFLINLLRRPERRRRMDLAARILKLNLTHWPGFLPPSFPILISGWVQRATGGR